MRIKYASALVLAILLFSVAAGAHHSHNVVTVKVLDGNGQPLKRACVTLVPRQGEIIFRNADGKGVVALRDIPAGNYRVTAKVDGFVAQKQEVFVGESGTVLVTFSLDAKS